MEVFVTMLLQAGVLLQGKVFELSFWQVYHITVHFPVFRQP